LQNLAALGRFSLSQSAIGKVNSGNTASGGIGFFMIADLMGMYQLTDDSEKSIRAK